MVEIEIEGPGQQAQVEHGGKQVCFAEVVVVVEEEGPAVEELGAGARNVDSCAVGSSAPRGPICIPVQACPVRR